MSNQTESAKITALQAAVDTARATLEASQFKSQRIYNAACEALDEALCDLEWAYYFQKSNQTPTA